jgi:hypothetical protein
MHQRLGERGGGGEVEKEEWDERLEGEEKVNESATSLPPPFHLPPSPFRPTSTGLSFLLQCPLPQKRRGGEKGLAAMRRGRQAGLPAWIIRWLRVCGEENGHRREK